MTLDERVRSISQGAGDRAIYCIGFVVGAWVMDGGGWPVVGAVLVICLLLTIGLFLLEVRKLVHEEPVE